MVIDFSSERHTLDGERVICHQEVDATGNLGPVSHGLLGATD